MRNNSANRIFEISNREVRSTAASGRAQPQGRRYRARSRGTARNNPQFVNILKFVFTAGSAYSGTSRRGAGRG